MDKLSKNMMKRDEALLNVKQGQTKVYDKLVKFVVIDHLTGKRYPMEALVCPADWVFIEGHGD